MRRLSLATAALAALWIGGCGSGDETEGFSLVPVTGKVTQNGKPVAGAQLSFTPNAKNKPQTPGDAVTDETGAYKATYRGRAGLSPGNYLVAVTKTAAGSKAGAGDTDAFMQKLGSETAASGESAGKVDNTFDREVPAAGGTLDFELKASAAAPAAPAKK
jgi:hypothetical protein